MRCTKLCVYSTELNDVIFTTWEDMKIAWVKSIMLNSFVSFFGITLA